jgi:hypothetical protein
MGAVTNKPEIKEIQEEARVLADELTKATL